MVAVEPPKAGVVVRVLAIARAIVAAKTQEIRRSAPLLGRRPCEARLGTAAGLGLGGRRKLGAGGGATRPALTLPLTLALTQAQAGGAPEVPRVVVAAAAAAQAPRAAAPIASPRAAAAASPRAAAAASPRNAARRLDDGAQHPDRAGVRLRLGFG